MSRTLQALVLGFAIWATVHGAAVSADRNLAVEAAAPAQQMLVMFHLPPGHFTGSSEYSGSYGDRLGHGARRRLAVRVAQRYGLTLAGDWPMPLAGVDCFIMSVPKGQSAAEVAVRVSQDRSVAWAEPIELYSAQRAVPVYNDPLFPMQASARAWRLADLHQIATGRNVRVAVIDSMVDAAHPDLLGQVLVSENFTASPAAGPEEHGTGVAGVIVARADNAAGIVGVAPGARLLALRACVEVRSARGVATTCDSLSLARALVFAIDHRADVINLSLSGPSGRLLGALLDAALARGATVVSAYDENQPDGGFPATHPGVIAVATEPMATTRSLYIAPGRDVLTTEPGARWGLANGSSYAAAHVSGLFALLRERGSFSHDARALVASRAGSIDPCASLLGVSGPCSCACARLATSSSAH